MNKISALLATLLLVIVLLSCSKTETLDPAVNQTYRLKLSGQIKTCGGVNLTNGYAIVVTNRFLVSIPITNGVIDSTFESSLEFDSIMVWAVDQDRLTTSDTIEMRVLSDSINLSQLNTCHKPVDEYVKCIINNETYVFVPGFTDTLTVAAWDTLGAPTTYIYRTGYAFLKSKFNRMQFAGMALGTYNVNWNSSLSISRYYSFNMPTSGYVTYTRYGNVGDYIEGTMNVPFVDNTDSIRYTLTGNFKVRRDN